MTLYCDEWRTLEYRIKGGSTLTNQWQIAKKAKDINLITVTLCWIRHLPIDIVRRFSNRT